MNAEEEKRLCIVVQQAVVAALNALFKESPGDTLGEVTAEGLDKTDDLYVKEMDLLGEQGLSEWSVDTGAVTGAVTAAVAAAAPSTDDLPPPPPALTPVQQQAQLQQAMLLADNVHGFPPKVCPKDGIPMNFSDLAGGYQCPQHGLNPKPGLLARLTGGIGEVSTAAVATTGALAGASMGMMGAAMQTQAQMAQMGQMVSAAPPPPPPGQAAAAVVACPTCAQPAQDMSNYGGAYVGKYYCNTCKTWVEQAGAPTVA
jgi:hypothetical protein